VHLTQILNGHIKKIDLCESCAKEKGVTDPEGFSLAELLSNVGHVKNPGDSGPAGQGLVCDSCGFTQQNLNKLGRMGCPDCYTTFAPILKPMLSNMHVGTTHCGKIPEHALARIDIDTKLAELESSIEKAIKEERYEDAAVYRDQMKQLRESTADTSVS
jgi:protein arginine kinase activator